MTEQSASAPKFSAQRLLIVGTGALGVSALPGWLGWLRETYPETETKVLLTRQASTFVAPAALAAIGGRPVEHDSWSTEPTTAALHVQLSQWADAIAVYPATFHFVSRFATGLADTPSLLALQCTNAPIGIAPALPPGGYESHAFRSHLSALRDRRNVVVAPPEPGRSVTSGRIEASTTAPLTTLLPMIEELRAELGEAGTS
ncbi:flavoprotein [Streptomyces globisporus]|uniref:Flavoprotein n=1 Tax=Streptomyces globisporus TaxID=1908 RepID=A0A423V751_STRGL|nr:flavoprotein [Streptomyces globisporus]ROV70441.1 flavoprotein [Streptomyces globisporus]